MLEKNMSHLSHEGQSKIDYCIECAVKHSQTSKVLMREAIQRARRNGAHSEGVKEKVRGAVEELTGMEDDTNVTQEENKNVAALNTAARDVRKFIHSTQAEIGGASLEQLGEIKEKTDWLVEYAYKVRESEEACPTCIVESEEAPSTKINLEEYGSKAKEKRKQFLEELQQENVNEPF